MCTCYMPTEDTENMAKGTPSTPVRHALCATHCAPSSVDRALWTIHCVVCTVHYALPHRHAYASAAVCCRYGECTRHSPVQ